MGSSCYASNLNSLTDQLAAVKIDEQSNSIRCLHEINNHRGDHYSRENTQEALCKTTGGTELKINEPFNSIRCLNAIKNLRDDYFNCGNTQEALPKTTGGTELKIDEQSNRSNSPDAMDIDGDDYLNPPDEMDIDGDEYLNPPDPMEIDGDEYYNHGRAQETSPGVPEGTLIEVHVNHLLEGVGYIEIHFKVPFLYDRQAFEELCYATARKILDHCRCLH